MLSKLKYYPESVFGGFTRVDGTISFYSRINALLESTHVILNVGCGRGAALEDACAFKRDLQFLRGRVKSVIGIDVDPAGGHNKYIDEFRLIQESGWPIESSSVNLIITDWTLEHVENTPEFFAEAARVLVPGGVFCARTPSSLGYVSLISKLIPESRHTAVLKNAQPERKTKDIFPAYYRCNSPSAIRRHLRKSQFKDIVVIHHEAEPSYFSFSSLLYALGVFHEKLWFSPFRLTLQCFARKANTEQPSIEK